MVSLVRVYNNYDTANSTTICSSTRPPITTATTATTTTVRQQCGSQPVRSDATKINVKRFWEQHSVRPPAHNPYYVTSHAAPGGSGGSTVGQSGQSVNSAGVGGIGVPGTQFVDVTGSGHHAQSAIAVPVMPAGAGRSLHYHTHAATHALPHQPPLTYPNWVPFTHFG